MTGTGKIPNPKVFISYSWKNPEYKSRVRELAERLISDGVKVILDQWDLKPGHDMYFFMEKSIEQSTSVLILCEETYAQKADNRGGGVGIETDIITPEIYEKHDQEKFIPVIMEHPRKLPKYLKRILAVDLTGMSMEDGYEELLCAVYGIPKIDKPDGGRTPSWIENRIGAARKTENSEKTKVETLTISSGGMEVRASQSGNDGRDVNNQIDQTDYSHITKPALGKTPEWVKDEIESSKPQYHVGDTIHFGSYPYEADGEKKKLEWRILAVEKDRMLIITQDLIECAPYNKDYKAVTWESCTLRKWMNGEFMDVAFDEKEKSRIILGTNSNPDNKRFNTKGGRKTEDRVFALSIDEVRRYFKNDSDRMAAPTPYVEEKYKDEVFIAGSYKVKGRGTGWWWLRSPGLSSDNAADVDVGGHIFGLGSYMVNSGGSVRPALWLNL